MKLNQELLNRTYPEGTTKEQWDKYEDDLKKHEEYCRNTKPKKSDYGKGIINPPLDEPASYERDLAEWEMMCSCDGPNKPGYFRANND
jgi:hypothetical protein